MSLCHSGCVGPVANAFGDIQSTPIGQTLYDQTGGKCALVSPWTGPRTLLSLWLSKTTSLMNHTFLVAFVLSVLVILVATIRKESLTFVSMYSVSDS